MRSLFLDFDGVLHPSLCEPAEYFCRMSLLEAALRDASVEIVISSSWRFHHSWDALMHRFLLPLRSRLVGATGEAVSGRHARWLEIQRYCERHGIVEWRALDDSSFEFPANCRELILCHGAVGLDRDQAMSLEQWLAR